MTGQTHGMQATSLSHPAPHSPSPLAEFSKRCSGTTFHQPTTERPYLSSKALVEKQKKVDKQEDLVRKKFAFAAHSRPLSPEKPWRCRRDAAYSPHAKIRLYFFLMLLVSIKKAEEAWPTWREGNCRWNTPSNPVFLWVIVGDTDLETSPTSESSPAAAVTKVGTDGERVMGSISDRLQQHTTFL